MSDYLEKLIAKAHGSLWDDPVTVRARDEEHGIRRDSFDKAQWAYALDRMPVLTNQVKHLEDDFPTSPAAYEDLYNSLLQGDPRPTDDEIVIERFLPQAYLMRALAESTEFKVLRKETKFDEFSTTLAMLTMKKKMRQAFETLQSILDAQQEAQDALAEALQAAQGALQSGEGDSDATETLEKALAGVGEAQDAAEDATETAVAILQTAGKDAGDKISEDRRTAESFGVSPGHLQRMSFDERRALADSLDTDKVREVADLIGAWRESARQERQRSFVHRPEEVVDYELGDDLSRLASSELVNLAMPELQDLFLLRMVKHELVIRETRSIDSTDGGPILFVSDESGTMGADLNGHTREAWSKGVGLALLDHAEHQKRDFIYIGYAGTGQVWVKAFPKGERTPEEVVDFVTHFYNGGTVFQPALRQAMTFVQGYQHSDRGRPDIVFATDGCFSVPEEFMEFWQEARVEHNVKCYGIQVGGSPSKDLRKLVDMCMQVDALNGDPDGVRNLFRTI